MKISLLITIFMTLLPASFSWGASKAPCDIKLHTYLYPTHGQYGYELIPYKTPSHLLDWYLVTYKMFPKTEISRVRMMASGRGYYEYYEGKEADGSSVTVFIDHTSSSAVAPYSFPATVAPDRNSTMSTLSLISAQRMNPDRPDMVSGGVLGRLDVCN